jgi:hypothetical protein
MWVLVVALVAGGCGAGGSTTAAKVAKTVTVTEGGASGGSPSSSSTTPPVATPDPKGRVSGSCDDLLGNIDENTGNMAIWFIADVTLHNTGNIGLKVNAKVVFGQVGSGPVIRVKRIRVKYRHAKTVHFKIPVTQQQESQYQAEANYGNGSCHISGTIMGTFGQAHPN